MDRSGKERRRLSLALGACALAVLAPLTARGQSAAAPPGDDAPFKNAGIMRLLFQDNAEEGRLRLAPIRWRGNTGFELRLTRSNDSGSRTQALEFASLDVATFVGQPWLVQLRGNLGLMTTQQHADADALDSRSAGERQGATAITGGVTVAVFPSSRFPFTASFETSDSRTSGEATPSDYTTRLAALRQSYRSPLGDQLYTGGLERSTLLSESFGRDTVTSLSGTAQRTFGAQLFDLSAAFAQNRRSRTNDGSDFGRFSARHSWRPNDTSTLESFASYTSTDFMASGGAGLHSRFLQLNSIGTWRPEEDSPLFVTGGLRMADASFGADDGGSSAQTLGANAAVSYALDPSTSLYAAATVARIGGGEGSSPLLTTQSIGANYSPPPVSLKVFAWSWNASTAGSNQTGAVEGRQHSLAAQANHQVSRGFPVGSAMSVNLAATQGFGIQDDSLRDPTRTLVHSGSIGVRVQPGTASDAFFSVNLGDSRSSGGRNDHFQIANFQASGQVQAGVYSLLSANLTVQGVRQRLDDQDTDQTNVLRSGTVSYQHARVFGMPRLRFIASATFNDIQLESRLLGDVSAPRDQYTRLYEMRLQYDIGRLEFRIGTRLASVNGKSDRQFFLRVNRQFGFF